MVRIDDRAIVFLSLDFKIALDKNNVKYLKQKNIYL
jgi:hypothetical protein